MASYLGIYSSQLRYARPVKEIADADQSGLAVKSIRYHLRKDVGESIGK